MKMSYPSQTVEPEELDEQMPREPAFLRDTGLDPAFVIELTLKALYYSARPTAGDLADTLALSLPVMQEALALLTRDGLCEIVAGEGQGPASYRYRLSGRGLERSGVAFERNSYVGQAPVPLKDYIAQVRLQSAGGSGFTASVVREALSQLVLSDFTNNRVGRAISSGRPTLIYGPSGNGKTTIAHLLGQALHGYIAVPYALEVYGHIVRLFDPSKHELADYAEKGRDIRTRRHDRRWAIARRPAVMTGGELTRQGLELVLDDRSKVYEAPLQMKANGGILIIDDFGRQQIPAVELLNRWIVALEGGVDHLSLHTGQTIEVPFDVIPFFSTNLPPEALADEAFLRRIRYKVEIPDPTPDEFRAIFARVCEEHGVAFHDEAVDHLFAHWYKPYERELRGCHPRDLVEAIVDSARYNESGPAMVTPESLDEVCHTYFLAG
jgi:predicted ATPase with chaperone activity